MKKYLKLSLFLIIAVMVCMTLAACGDKPPEGGDDSGSTIPAALPEFTEQKTELTEDATKEIIKDLVGENSEDITGGSSENQESVTDKIIKFEAFTAENIDGEKFLAYVNACQAQGYALIGDYTENGKRMVALSAESDKIILVTLKDGVMTAIMYQIELPEEIVYEWPTAMLNKFGLSGLAQPDGSELSYVYTTTVKGLEKYDSVTIILRNATKEMYNSILAAVRSSGYSVLKGDEERDDFYATSVINEEEIYCFANYLEHGNNTEIQINIYNEKQRRYLDKGISFCDVYPEATYTVTSIYTDKMNNDGKEGMEDAEFLRTDRLSMSYNANGAIEYYGETPETNTARVFRLSDRKVYSLTNAGHNLSPMENSDVKTIWSFVNDPLQGLFKRSYNQTKTGAVKNIAGIDCAEYISTVTETYYDDRENKGNSPENESVVSYTAKYYIEETSGLCFGYVGRIRPEHESEGTITVTDFKPNQSIVDSYLDLPADGVFFNEFPSEQIKEELGISDFMPEIRGAEGYYVQYNYENISQDGATTDYKLVRRYLVKGVDRTELEAYEKLLLSKGFVNMDNGYCVYLENLDRISIHMTYDSENPNLLVFYFTTDKYERNPILDNSITVEYLQGIGETEKHMRINFSDRGVLLGEYNTIDMRTVYHYYKWSESEKIYRYYRFNDWDEYTDMLNDSYESETFNERTLTERLASQHETSSLFLKKNSEWIKTGEGGINGMPVEIYDAFYSTFYYSLDYGFLMQAVDKDSNEVYYSVKAISDYNPEYTAFGEGTPVFGGAQEIFTFGVDEYLRDFSQQNEYSKEFFAENYSDFRLVKVCGNVTNDEFLSFKQSVDDKNYRVLENYIDYKYDDNDNRTDEVIIARLYLTDSVDYVLEITYDLGCLHVLEYRLKHGAEDFFGDELNAENEYNDFYASFGDGRYTVKRDRTDEFDNYPTNEIKTFFVGGNNFYDGYLLVVAQGNMAQKYNVSQFGGRMAIMYKYEEDDTIISKSEIFNMFVPYELRTKRNLSKYTVSGAATILGRECTIYDGILSNRGKKSNIKIYQDKTTGLYLKLEIAGSENIVCEFTEITSGNGYCDFDVTTLPEENVNYKASEWKDSYYGYDFVPRVVGFSEFKILTGSIEFYGDDLTLGEFDPDLTVDESDYGRIIQCTYVRPDGTEVKFTINKYDTNISINAGHRY